jgi:hypothetical protein
MRNNHRANTFSLVAATDRAYWKRFGRICLVAAVCGIFCAPALADFKVGKTHGGAKIPVQGPPGSTVTLITTGTATGKNPPPEIATHETILPASGELTYNVPVTDKDPNNPDPSVQPQTVVDYKLQILPPGKLNLQFSLNVESFTPSGPDFIQNTISDELFETLGDGVELRIPDFEDADDPDQTLFGAVNLVNFIPGNVNFNLGDNFTIVNGVSPDLPGMVFGTSEVLMDPTSADGFDDVDPFNGTITVTGENDPSSTPLPASVWGGLTLIAGISLHRFTRQRIAR